MDDASILTVSGLTKDYGSFRAVDRISFGVNAGEIVGLLGPNGAGKTTTINMILGILEPTGGAIEILGKNLEVCRAEAAKIMNFAAVYAHVPANLTVRQNLYIFALLYEIKNVKDAIAAVLKKFDLEALADVKAGLLSSGESSRLSLAKALINNPRLLLLDEPTASLDPSVSQYTRGMIKRYVAENKTAVLWTSHNMREIETVCDRVLFLSHGTIVLEGDPKSLAHEHGQKNLEELFIKIAREPLETS